MQTSLTVDNVLTYLYPWSHQWVTVANKLHLPTLVINSIQASQVSDRASLKTVVEWWFQNTANPEWNTIEGIYYYVCNVRVTNRKRFQFFCLVIGS